MADACVHCGGRGWTWNGYRRVPCGRRHREPNVVMHVPVADWPAVRERLLRRVH